jgi:two-component system, LytTR family, response regulator
MRVLIVDDEPLARDALANALAARTDVEVFDSADNAIEALGKLRSKPYDIVLLDIHMPELSGIELADLLNNSKQTTPAIVFVTAHDEHAIAAFEKHVLDYVLKPFSNERIHEALNVALRRTASERAAGLMEIMLELKGELSKPRRVAIKVKGRTLLINPAEVIAVEAEGNYVLLRRPSDSYLLRGSISKLAEKLRAYGFIQIHRSVLVNASCVQEIQPWTTGEYLLRTRGGKEYTVSRTYKENLRCIARSWVGSEALFSE